jgi:hypothetical protein
MATNLQTPLQAGDEGDEGDEEGRGDAPVQGTGLEPALRCRNSSLPWPLQSHRI